MHLTMPSCLSEARKVPLGDLLCSYHVHMGWSADARIIGQSLTETGRSKCIHTPATDDSCTITGERPVAAVEPSAWRLALRAHFPLDCVASLRYTLSKSLTLWEVARRWHGTAACVRQARLPMSLRVPELGVHPSGGPRLWTCA